ncbi:MAG: GWxTD domain-containing protein [Chlorobi bacterium]|nr:GWxTD domain-containing protein [Chlorobiota bacterium]
MRHAISVLVGVIVWSSVAHSSPTELRMTTMYVRSQQPDSCRLDVYLAVPYAWLQFTPGQQSFIATYRLRINVSDAGGRTVAERTLDRTIEEADRSIASGSTDATDITQTVLLLPPGTYRIEARLTDQLSNRQQSAQQTVVIPDYRRSPIGISGILLVERIEERDRRYVLTPIIGNDISSYESGFFVFYEVYAPPRGVTFVRARILDSTTAVFNSGWQTLRTDSSGRLQHFVRMTPPLRRMPQGKYAIRIEATSDTSRSAAMSEHVIELRYGASSTVFTDITKAIRQLRYIATQAEIDSMLALPTDSERRAAFEQFWQRYDPTPGTLRNEAFEEYFARIEYANRNFRSYAEGWLTDMGMVYIVLGEPSSVERRVSTFDNRSLVIWTYARLNRRFIFVDNTGFGDYRLSPSTPFFPSEKYRYSGS